MLPVDVDSLREWKRLRDAGFAGRHLRERFGGCGMDTVWGSLTHPFQEPLPILSTGGTRTAAMSERELEDFFREQHPGVLPLGPGYWQAFRAWYWKSLPDMTAAADAWCEAMIMGREVLDNDCVEVPTVKARGGEPATTAEQG